MYEQLKSIFENQGITCTVTIQDRYYRFRQSTGTTVYVVRIEEEGEVYEFVLSTFGEVLEQPPFKALQERSSTLLITHGVLEAFETI